MLIQLYVIFLNLVAQSINVLMLQLAKGRLKNSLNLMKLNIPACAYTTHVALLEKKNLMALYKTNKATRIFHHIRR